LIHQIRSLRQNYRIIEFDASILHLLVMFGADIFKWRRGLEAENLFPRYQLNIALRRAPPRAVVTGRCWYG
jgi:hypothetical protein